MLIKKINTGILDVNTYVLIDEDTKEAIIIDLGGNFEEVNNYINSNNAKLQYILNTHGHFDHILGEKTAQDTVNVPIYMHKEDEFLVKNLPSQMTMWGLDPAEAPEITDFIDENSDLYIGKQKIEIFHTPGHSPGGLSFLIGNDLFSGDTLFRESVGRCDLPGGNFSVIKKSINEKLFKLPQDTVVYPGHGDSSTIEHEIKYNDFL